MSETGAKRLPARFDQHGAVEFPDQDGRGGSVVLRGDGTAWNRTGLTASWEPLLELPYDALARSLTTMRDATEALIQDVQKDRQRVLDLERPMSRTWSVCCASHVTMPHVCATSCTARKTAVERETVKGQRLLLAASGARLCVR